ncbi:MAG TPA: M20/M25/M40 family metallo-hydrolase, partial [Acidimicrobiia bacterium]|nr:M20/M25/M40 family metallo-hydrolase [Acidimicrobiia bacterium]
MTADLTAAVNDLFPDVTDELTRLVRIPSVSAPGFEPARVRESADATADLLRRSGFSGVTLLEIDGAHPAVYAEMPGPEGVPTVLLYAHHDVQPPGPDAEWPHGEPFVPAERDGRLYGRGSSDDKGGVVTHAAMGRLFDGSPPVNLKVFIEGEEEIGSAHLTAFLDEYGPLLASDVIVIADSTNWRVGVPSITTSLRGLVSVRVEVAVLEAGVHSGMFGGAVPDALTILTRVLASLHDDAGNVAVPGLVGFDSDPLDLTEDELRGQAGVLPSVELLGDGSLTTRLWSRPAAAVLAIDAPPVKEAINQLIPRASAKVSVRIAPGDEPARAMDSLISYLSGQPAWGAEVTVTPLESGEPFALTPGDPRVEAFRDAMRSVWGVEPVDMGIGGSIPFVAAFSEANPEAAILLVGAGDPTSAAHGPNES